MSDTQVQTITEKPKKRFFNLHLKKLSLSAGFEKLALKTGLKLPKYSFEPLRGSEYIRVLEVCANQDRIECKIRQVKFSKGGYQALSYVWGSKTKPFRAVVVDNHGKSLGWLPLTENLYYALCNIRDCTELKSKVFWIDQICIHQDGVEKNHQVALMGNIYKQASGVVLYVGPSDETEEESKGIGLIRQLHDHFDPMYNRLLESWNEEAVPADICLPQAMQDEMNNDTPEEEERRYNEGGWKWLCKVAFGEWLERLWIVQEQVLNKKNIILRGSVVFEWDALVSLPILLWKGVIPYHYVRLFWDDGFPEHRPGSFLTPTNFANVAYSLMRMRRNTLWATGMPLLGNMGRYQHLQCHDPLDKIYAVISISSDTKDIEIDPDYSQSPTQLFINTTVSLLEKCHDMDVLPYACRWGNPTDKSLPSWSLNVPRHLGPENYVFHVYRPHLYKDLKVAPRFDEHDPILYLKGRVIDYISFHAPPIIESRSFNAGISDPTWLKTATDILTSWSNVLEHVGVTIENTGRLCSSIMADYKTWATSTGDTDPALERMFFHFWSRYKYLFRQIRVTAAHLHLPVEQEDRLETMLNKLHALVDKKLHPESGKALDPMSEEERLAEVKSRYYTVVEGRSFSVTKAGRICNAMKEVNPGDAVAVFQGTDRLFILRQAGDKYRLIGDAFIHGLMFGESYEGLDPEEVDSEIGLI